MLWDFLMYHRLGEVERKASDASYDARTITAELHRVRDDLERMQLVQRAMWDLLREPRGLTDEDLAAKITELDLQDGVRDGKLATAARTCPTCKRTMGRRHAHCLYCGVHDATRPPYLGPA